VKKWHRTRCLSQIGDKWWSDKDFAVKTDDRVCQKIWSSRRSFHASFPSSPPLSRSHWDNTVGFGILLGSPGWFCQSLAIEVHSIRIVLIESSTNLLTFLSLLTVGQSILCPPEWPDLRSNVGTRSATVARRAGVDGQLSAFDLPSASPVVRCGFSPWTDVNRSSHSRHPRLSLVF
jgi:hypothetical protein